MELNGVANMLQIVRMAEEDKQIDPKVAEELKDQLDVLERYMCALRKAQDDGTYVPAWSTVRDNRNLYPNNRGEVRHDVHRQS